MFRRIALLFPVNEDVSLKSTGIAHEVTILHLRRHYAGKLSKLPIKIDREIKPTDEHLLGVITNKYRGIDQIKH